MLYKLSQFHRTAEESDPVFEEKPLEKEGETFVCKECEINDVDKEDEVCSDCKEMEMDTSQQLDALEDPTDAEVESAQLADDDEDMDMDGEADDVAGSETEKKQRKVRELALHHKVITPHVERAVQLLQTRGQHLDGLADVDRELGGIHELLVRNDGLTHPLLAKNKGAKQWFENMGRKRKVAPKKKDAEIIETLTKVAAQLRSVGDLEGVSLTESILRVFAKKSNDTTEKQQDSARNGLYGVSTLEKTKREYPEAPLSQFSAPSLSTRYCPDHHGAMMKRIGEGSYQCELDGKVYNWNEGFKDYYGNQFPPGQVQSIDFPNTIERAFETRQSATNKNN